MKKLMALIALVAMVAVSSVAFAQFDPSADVTLANNLDITDCTTTPPTVSFNASVVGDFDLVKNDSCDVIVDAGAVWDLDSIGTNNAAGDMLHTVNGTDSIAGYTGDITGQGGLDGGAWGLWLGATTGNATVDNCTAATAVCANSNTALTGVNHLVVDEGPLYQETMALNIEVAVDNDVAGGIQPAGTYDDTITLSLI